MEEKTTTQLQTYNFFNFEFDVLEWQIICCRMDWQLIPTDIWNSLWDIKQKYDKMKKRKREFDKKQKHYCESLEAWKKDKEHLQEHIRKAETKLCEYKNTILAFGKLATCNSISK